jgi:hypothetical protein
VNQLCEDADRVAERDWLGAHYQFLQILLIGIAVGALYCVIFLLLFHQW